MKIDYIKTIGFRKFKKIFETKLYDTTMITGKNCSGKSNILYAIVNIILGTNLSGDDKVCIINNKSDSSYGELHFTDDNGKKHIIVRSKHKYNNSMNFLTLDGKVVNQNELLNFYRDKKLFLSIINPMYFLLKKSAEQKEMIDKYLSDIRPKEIFDKLNSKEQELLLQKYCKIKNVDFNTFSSTEKEEFINLHMTNIFLDIAFSRLNNDEQALLEGIPRNIPTYIIEINNNIKQCKTTISNLDGKIEYATNIVKEDIPNLKVFEKQEELDFAIQELDFFNTENANVEKAKEDKNKLSENIKIKEKEILKLKNEISNLSIKMQNGKIEYYKIKNEECGICPTCGQSIQDESKNKTIENMKKSLTDEFEKKKMLEEKLKDMEIELDVDKAKCYSISLEEKPENSQTIEEIKANIRELQNEQKEIEKYNGSIEIKKQNVEMAKQNISKFKAEKDSQNKIINQLKQVKEIAQKLYIASIEEKMKLVTQYFKNVNIKFYSVLKTTGEIKDDFIITYKGKELIDLSRSETIATALEFANMFNQISKANFPIFIDDYESCADYNFINDYSKKTQVIVSKVEKGHLLKIADYNNSMDCTIIKPNIHGYKNIKGYRMTKEHKINNVPNAA